MHPANHPPESLSEAEIPSHCGPFLGPVPVPFPAQSPRFALVSLPHTARTPSGRAKVRDAFQTILSEWAGHPVALEETNRGPELRSPIRGKSVFLSVSYSKTTAWLALALDSPVGLDAVSLIECEDWSDVATLYFGPSKAKAIACSQNPRRSFALHWATLEARCKQAGLPLSEETPPPATQTYTKIFEHTVLAVAF